MRLHVHDFSGHPFQVQLSRALAARGHRVRHSYCSQYVSGKGALAPGPADPATFSVAPVAASRSFEKYRPVRRALFEIAYARDLWRALAAEPVDAVVLCNAPLMTTYLVKVLLGRRGVPWSLWHQDIYSLGMRDELARILPGRAAAALAALFRRMERACVRDAAAVVAIDDVFLDQYRAWSLDTAHAVVVPNWAPVGEIVPGGRDNPWAREHGLPRDSLRLLYSGTLGRKHNPLLLLDLLRHLRGAGVDAHLTVVSEGDGAELLREAARPGDEVLVLPFQDAARFSDVLAGADVLVTLLEPEASRFSIPSKVLSYLAAGRPVAGLMPAANAASGLVRRVGGHTADPDAAGVAELAGWVAALAADPARAAALGAEARRAAELEFDIERISARFDVLVRALGTGERAGARSGDGERALLPLGEGRRPQRGAEPEQAARREAPHEAHDAVGAYADHR